MPLVGGDARGGEGGNSCRSGGKGAVEAASVVLGKYHNILFSLDIYQLARFLISISCTRCTHRAQRSN